VTEEKRWVEESRVGQVNFAGLPPRLLGELVAHGEPAAVWYVAATIAAEKGKVMRAATRLRCSHGTLCRWIGRSKMLRTALERQGRGWKGGER
jgi:hypothetical protein